MKDLLQPLRADSLKELFIKRFEELILSGKLSIGEKLPSERELAAELGVSRPVVHEGLVDLSLKGLITLKPRVGAIVNDFRKEGSLAMLTSLFQYREGGLDIEILESILDVRILFEVEIARLAAKNRTDDHLAAFGEIAGREEAADPDDMEGLAAVDFDFHHQVAMATGNLMYPLLLNSMKRVYTNISGVFFSDPAVVPAVLGFHRRLTAAIREQDPPEAARVMEGLLRHGESQLRRIANLTPQEERP
jgi:DNA-binding FadR family transcriptional regulator